MMSQLTEQEIREVEKLVGNLHGEELFEDEEFKADISSLTYTNRESTHYKSVQWVRPYDLSSNPKLIVKCTTRSDVNQGELNNCWFLSACAAIAQNPKLVSKVMPPGQVLSGTDYRGIVIFRFWRLGQWESVYIDDRLPVSENGNLIYARCTDHNEFWLPLLEKAYAKFQGNYQVLNGGQLDAALVQLTGHIIQSISLKDEAESVERAKQDELHKQLVRDFHKGSFLTCSRMCGTDQGVGLAQGHAYTITNILTIDVRGYGRIRMVRVRDPWGQNKWNGEWNCRDPRWNLVDTGSLNHMDISSTDDGEFWMPFSKFITEFREIVISAENLDCSDYTPGITRNMFTMIDQWEEGETAGGCAEVCWENFAINPQYLLEVLETDDCQQGEWNNSSYKNVLIELIQDSRQWMPIYKMAITIFRVNNEDVSNRLAAEDMKQITYDNMYNSEYKTLVYLHLKVQMDPGMYVIIPSTYEQASQKFVLRVYSSNLLRLRQLPRCYQ